MAMINCSECGVNVSSEAPACVTCGAPLPAVANPDAKVELRRQRAKEFDFAKVAGAAAAGLGVLLWFTGVFIPGVVLVVVGILVLAGAIINAKQAQDPSRHPGWGSDT
jgi:hypothetical protein